MADRLATRRDLELAWCAGFFDGEGSTSVQRPSAKSKGITPCLRVSITQKDRQVLDRFREAMGVGKVYGPYSSCTPHYYCALQQNGLTVLALMWPYLSRIKKIQALTATESIGVEIDV